MTDIKSLIDAVLAMALHTLDPNGSSNVRSLQWLPPQSFTNDWRGSIVITYK